MAFKPIDYNEHNMINEMQAYNQEVRHDPNAVQLGQGEEKGMLQAMQAGASNDIFQFMVLGKEGIRSDTELAANLGGMAVSPVKDNTVTITQIFKQAHPAAASPLVNEYVKTLSTQGAVMNTTNWHVFKNDCFIYGALKGGKSFNLALERPLTVDDVWDTTSNRPRILGRELCMLKLSGYTAHKTGMEVIFQPPNPNTTPLQEASLSDYRKMINSIQTPQEILSFLQNNQLRG